jgi:hypothetical protein
MILLKGQVYCLDPPVSNSRENKEASFWWASLFDEFFQTFFASSSKVRPFCAACSLFIHRPRSTESRILAFPNFCRTFDSKAGDWPGNRLIRFSIFFLNLSVLISVSLLYWFVFRRFDLFEIRYDHEWSRSWVFLFGSYAIFKRQSSFFAYSRALQWVSSHFACDPIPRLTPWVCIQSHLKIRDSTTVALPCKSKVLTDSEGERIVWGWDGVSHDVIESDARNRNSNSQIMTAEQPKYSRWTQWSGDRLSRRLIDDLARKH